MASVHPQSATLSGSRSKRCISASVMAATALLGLAACRGGSSEDGASGSPGPIKVAVVADVTGVVQLLGAEGTAGFFDAVADFNDAGGVDGRKVKVAKFDSQSEANAAQAAWRNAYADEPSAIFFSGLSSNLSTGYALQKQKQIPILAASSTEDLIKEPFFFTVYATLKGSGKILVDGAAEKLGGSLEGKKIGVVSVNTAAASSQVPGIKQAVKDLGGKVVATELNETGIASFTTQAQKMAAKKPDAVVTLEAGDQVVITKALVTAGVTGPIIGSVGGASDAQFAAINAPNYFGLRDVLPPLAGTDLFAIAKKRGSTGKATSAFYSYGYALGTVLTKALDDCGGNCVKTGLIDAIHGVGSITPPNYLQPLDFSKYQSGLTGQGLYGWDPSTKKAVKAGASIKATGRR